MPNKRRKQTHARKPCCCRRCKIDYREARCRKEVSKVVWAQRLHRNEPIRNFPAVQMEANKALRKRTLDICKRHITATKNDVRQFRGANPTQRTSESRPPMPAPAAENYRPMNIQMFYLGQMRVLGLVFIFFFLSFFFLGGRFVSVCSFFFCFFFLETEHVRKRRTESLRPPKSHSSWFQPCCS